MKLVLLLIFSCTLSAHALGEYYSAKIQGKDYHFFTSPTGSYFYAVGSNQTYFLKKEILLGTIKKFEVFDTLVKPTSVGQVKIADDKLEVFELNNIKAKNVKLKKLKIDIEQVPLARHIYNSDKCSFRFIDLYEINDTYLFREVSFLISEIMDTFKDLDCDYLKSNRATEMNTNLNQLTCDNEVVFLKKRFYGVTFICRASMAKSTDFKFRVFSLIFDKTLKARVSKSDFTDSDFPKEDDYKDLEFRLTPVGLGLYSADLLENKEEYVKIVPYVDLKKNFTVWGKPKRYLSHFVLKP